MFGVTNSEFDWDWCGSAYVVIAKCSNHGQRHFNQVQRPTSKLKNTMCIWSYNSNCSDWFRSLHMQKKSTDNGGHRMHHFVSASKMSKQMPRNDATTPTLQVDSNIFLGVLVLKTTIRLERLRAAFAIQVLSVLNATPCHLPSVRAWWVRLLNCWIRLSRRNRAELGPSGPWRIGLWRQLLSVFWGAGICTSRQWSHGLCFEQGIFPLDF